MAHPTENPWLPLEKVPPFLAHAIAINNGGKRRFTLDEIVARSGLKERTYLRYARMLSWDSIRKRNIQQFLAGTGVNPWRFERHRNFLRKHGASLSWVNARQRAIFNELSAEWLKPKPAQQKTSLH